MKYMECTADELEFIAMIDEMDNGERRQFRAECTRVDPNVLLPRNLYYNYETQSWI